MMAPPPAHPAASNSTSLVKHYEHYFAPDEVQRLTTVSRGKQSIRQAEATRLAACAFAESVGARLGFPRRTIATAQLLYHRFHLFFALRDFPSFHEPVLAALYVSAKLHDTLKKPREIVLASYGVRFPELLGGKATLSDADVDVAALEADRLKVLSIERLMLETVCFNFSVQTPFEYVLKFGHALGASKALSLAAYRISIDCYRTLLPLSYPPHALALASFYLAALLARSPPRPLANTQTQPDDVEEKAMMLERARAGAIEEVLGSHGTWEAKYGVWLADVEEITHQVLDLFATCLSSSPASSAPAPKPVISQTSPPSAEDVAPDFSSTAVTLLALSQRAATDALTELKIALRQRTAARAERVQDGREGAQEAERRRAERERGEGVGRNEGTVRFLFS